MFPSQNDYLDNIIIHSLITICLIGTHQLITSCAYIHRLLYNITMYLITYLAIIIIIRYILYSDTLIRRLKKFSYILLTVYIRTYHVATVS